MPIDNKIILYFQSTYGASANDYKIPPCAGKVTLELFGKGSWGQCSIPLSGGGVGTTATQCSKSLVSLAYRARWYGKTQVTSANLTDSSIFGIICTCSYSYFKINSGGYGAGGVKLPNNASYYASPCYRIGDVVYSGGFHGRKYVTCSATISCGKGTTTGYGAIWGGWGGDAGPRGPGGNGASAYTNNDYQTSTTYYPGGGGGANGGTNASTSTAGRSFWNTPSSFGAGGSGGSTTTFYSGTYCNAACVSIGGYGGGKTTGGGLSGNINFPPNINTIYGTLTAYLGTKAPSGTTYKHVFSTPGVYQIYVPIGTTSIQVDVLGGGASGNLATSQSAPGFNAQIGTNAGGGGGGYARSTLVRNFTTLGAVIDVQVASRKTINTPCSTYKSSKVTIDGVLEAEAYTAFDVRGGGCYTNAGTGWNANYARNGLTRIGGKGGAGYSTNCRGGGGGGASWYGGVGGTGGSAISTRPSGGGGGAASCSAAGSTGTTSASTTAGGIGGASGTGSPSSGGTPGNGVFNNTTIFLYGKNGAGGGGGSTTCVSTRSFGGGTGGQSTYLAAGSVFSFCGYKAAAAGCYGGSSYGYVFGPGGGGGGGYGGGGSSGYGGNGGSFGGGGGGGRAGYDIVGGYGLVIVAITVDSALAASSVRFDTSTSHVQVI
jgi:hypothetical protein